MGTVIAILSGRFGGIALAAAGLLLAGMAVTIGALKLSNAGLKVQMAAEQARAAKLEAAIAEQNAAVERMHSEATTAQAAAADRARQVLRKPPRAANPKTAEEMDQWLTGQ